MATTAPPATETVTLTSDGHEVTVPEGTTIDEIDPMGKIPQFEFCAVRLEPAAYGAGP